MIQHTTQEPADAGRRLTFMNRRVVLAFVIAVLCGVAASACTSTDQASSGIAGTMTATGGRAGTLDSPASGQILIWATTESAPATAVGLAPRPLQAIATSGEFTVELEPGFYVVRGTELGGLVCGELTVEVAPREMTKVGFLCQHR